MRNLYSECDTCTSEKVHTGSFVLKEKQKKQPGRGIREQIPYEQTNAQRRLVWILPVGRKEEFMFGVLFSVLIPHGEDIPEIVQSKHRVNSHNLSPVWTQTHMGLQQREFQPARKS